MKTKIMGTGSYVPERVVTNDDLAGIVDTSDEWIRTRTGIGRRHISDGPGTTAMAAEAARRAMENAGVGPEDIDLIIVGTTTADHCFPSAACEVQGAIGADRAVGYDISAACSGFIFALNMADALIKTQGYRTGLVIGADNLSKIVDWSDRSTCVLFGDGAGAAIVRGYEADGRVTAGQADFGSSEDGASRTEGRFGEGQREALLSGGILSSEMGSDGRKSGVLKCESRTMGNFLTGTKPEIGYITMEGQEVFKFAVKKVPECILKVLADSGTDVEEIKYFVLHQANYRICESIAKRLKVSMDRIPMNIEKYGNTSGATIPVLLDEMNREGKLQAGDKIVLSGFGAGLTWGAVLIQW